MIADTPDKEMEMNTENDPQVEIQLPGLLEMSDLLRGMGVETKSFHDQQVAEAAYRAGYQAALNARAGGDAKDAERWRALRTMTWRVHEIEPSEFDEHGDEAIAAALASQAVGVKDGR